MSDSKKYHLFEVVGIELEYMMVNKESLKVVPFADKVLRDNLGNLSADVDRGVIGWSNELVSHVIELKTNGPVESTKFLDQHFHKNIHEINDSLANFGAMLMPGGAHPTMDPFTETEIWPHEYNEVYALYNSIFDCCGHGWSNVQSTHINLPFANDSEFRLLHGAIRLILPIIPAISAASPFLDGKLTKTMDGRLEQYKLNQAKIPSIAGLIIPEPVYSKADYQSQVFDKIYADIKPFDKEGILSNQFLNSRGAIARFDRNAIEIRLVDNQECPKADIAVVNLIVEVLKDLVNRIQDSHFKISSEELRVILDDCIKLGEKTQISNKEFLMALGFPPFPISAETLWYSLFARVKSQMPKYSSQDVETLLATGTLAGRMIKGAGTNPSAESLKKMMKDLCYCLENNQFYLP